MTENRMLIGIEAFFSHVSFAAALFDVTRRLRCCSPKFESNFIINFERPEELQLETVLKNNHELLDKVKEVYAERRRLTLPEIVVHFGSERKTLSAEIFAVYDDRQEFWGVSLHLWDARERSIFVEQKSRSESLAGLAALASGLAHEIKNPLSGIRGAAQMLLADAEEKEDSGRKKKYLQMVIDESARVDRLVQSLLHLTKPRVLVFAPVNINRILRESRMLVQAAAGDQVVFIENFDPSLPEIQADEDALRQIVLNLLKNALDALGKSGLIKIKSEFMPNLSIRTAEKKRKIIRVTIEDSGPGIAQENIDKIFTPYFSTKLEGTGLGLALVNQLVELHQGSIIVNSSLGVGSTFAVYLPV